AGARRGAHAAPRHGLLVCARARRGVAAVRVRLRLSAPVRRAPRARDGEALPHFIAIGISRRRTRDPRPGRRRADPGSHQHRRLRGRPHARSARGPMKFSASLAFTDTEDYLELAVLADEYGWDTLVLSDHLVHPETIHAKYPYRDDGQRPWEAPDHWP